MLKLENCK